MNFVLNFNMFILVNNNLVRLKDLLQTGHHTDVGTQPSDCFGDQVTDVLPNKDTPDHTHWVSGDDTDSDWASPVHHNDNANQKLLPQQTTKTRKCPSTKRSLFSSQGDSSLEQLELCSVKKYNGKVVGLKNHIVTIVTNLNLWGPFFEHL